MRGNALLSALPPGAAERLMAHAQRVRLEKRTVLCEVDQPFDYGYFPLNGMVSLISTTEDGDGVEVASVGCEGMIGLPILWPAAHAPYEAHVRLPTDVWRVRASVLRAEFKTLPGFQDVMVGYLHALVQRLSQTAVCYRFHTGRQRVCGWLLAAADRAGSDVLELTHEMIAHSLGIPRTGVTSISVELQDAGALRCRHGRLTILNRSRLEAAACDCCRTSTNSVIPAK